MKIEVEIDEKELLDKLLRQLEERAYCTMKYEVEKWTKEVLRATIFSKTKDLVTEMLKSFTFSDGTTFQAYVERLISRDGKVPYGEKLRLGETVERQIIVEATKIFNDTINEHVKQFKAGIANTIQEYLKRT